MILAGVVIETVPGAGPRVAARLLDTAGLELQGGDGDRRIAAVFTAVRGDALEALAEELVRNDAEVLGVFPTYVAETEDAGAARAEAEASLPGAGTPGADGP